MLKKITKIVVITLALVGLGTLGGYIYDRKHPIGVPEI